ncbi:MAG TPA: hypothetical protein VGC77_10275 [Rhodopseudomonas sp.]|uniref:hypothetical protein n=1 Tax=Rhodopseudomonas sp. TaxID=1078 RepID=UPI002EDB8C91
MARHIAAASGKIQRRSLLMPGLSEPMRGPVVARGISSGPARLGSLLLQQWVI